MKDLTLKGLSKQTQILLVQHVLVHKDQSYHISEIHHGQSFSDIVYCIDDVVCIDDVLFIISD